MILGVDLSHHKSGGSLANLKEQGYSFVILKATEGDSFKDPAFREYLDQADEFKIPVAAYHYVRAASSMESQVALISKTVPKNVPMILDIERGSGDQVHVWVDMITALRNHGYVVPMIYLPRWYWVEIGQPGLGELPPLWGSRYVSGSGYGSDLFRQVPASWWSGYGNNFVGMLQFSSQVTVGGLPPNVDVNAFVGSTGDLMDLFVMEDHVSASDVWAEILTSPTGYQAPAREWLLATSARVEDMKGEVENFMTVVTDFMGEVRGKLDGVNGPTVEQLTEAFVAALPNLKIAGEFHGGTDTSVG